MKNSRIYFLALSIIIICFVLIGRLFFLQVLNHDFYQELAANQHNIHKILFPKRGEIFIKDRFYKQDSSELFSLAINRTWQMVYAIPNEIQDREEVVEKLSPLLKLGKEELKKRINKRSDPYEPLEHKLSSSIVQKIKELNIKGIELEEETQRYYPANDLASHVLGFVGFFEDKRMGQYGIEGYYNEKLEGVYGFLEGEKDTAGRLIAVAKQNSQPAEDGVDLVLTLDPNIQYFVEEKLKEIFETLDAESGTIIIENPKTGAIKALANWPQFDPNKYYEVDGISTFLNPAINGVFEPGSVFKPITMAIALNKKLITPNTVYEDKGFVKIRGSIIRNSHPEPEGIQTMTQVLEKSLNTGAVFVNQLISKKVFKEYLDKFGFSKKTGIDLGGEVKGNLSNLNTNGDVEFATASFGQGIAVTPIELVAAFSAIANHGEMVRPHIVEKFIYNDGKEEKVEKEVIARPISENTANELTKMMISVIENGFGKEAGVDGYFVAGKTGTAEVPNIEEGGYSDKTIHCFIGFFPAFDPEFTMLIKLDNPKGIRFAADSIAPVFGEIAEYILNYYEIPPSR